MWRGWGWPAANRMSLQRRRFRLGVGGQDLSHGGGVPVFPAVCGKDEQEAQREKHRARSLWARPAIGTSPIAAYPWPCVQPVASSTSARSGRGRQSGGRLGLPFQPMPPAPFPRHASTGPYGTVDFVFVQRATGVAVAPDFRPDRFQQRPGFVGIELRVTRQASGGPFRPLRSGARSLYPKTPRVVCRRRIHERSHVARLSGKVPAIQGTRRVVARVVFARQKVRSGTGRSSGPGNPFRIRRRLRTRGGRGVPDRRCGDLRSAVRT